jgi:hypothetical protein
MAELGMAFLNPIAEAQRIGSAEAQEERTAAAAPSVLEHTKALSRLATAEAGKMEGDAEVEKRAATMMAQTLGSKDLPGSGPKDGKPPKPSDMFLAEAQMYAFAGSPAKAAELLGKASQAAEREQTAEAARVRAQGEQLTQRLKVYEKGNALLGGIKDDATLQQANEDYARVMGRPSPLEGLDYETAKPLVEGYKSKLLNAEQTARLALERLRTNAQVARDAASIRHMSVLEDLDRKKVQISRERLDAQLKGGGKDVPMPSDKAVEAASAALSAIPGLVSDTDRPVAAVDVAKRAAELRLQNKGIAPSEAIKKAIAEKREAGDFKSGTPPKTFLGFPVPTTGKAAGAYEAPQVVPKGGISKLKDGQRYFEPGKPDKVYIWNAKTKSWANVPKSPTSGGGSIDDAPDDEDEPDATQ